MCIPRETDRQIDRDREEILIVHPCCRDEKEQMKKLRDVVEMRTRTVEKDCCVMGEGGAALFLREHHQDFFRNWNRTLVLSFSALIFVAFRYIVSVFGQGFCGDRVRFISNR
jgi:hypothetical protein